MVAHVKTANGRQTPAPEKPMAKVELKVNVTVSGIASSNSVSGDPDCRFAIVCEDSDFGRKPSILRVYLHSKYEVEEFRIPQASLDKFVDGKLPAGTMLSWPILREACSELGESLGQWHTADSPFLKELALKFFTQGEALAKALFCCDPEVRAFVNVVADDYNRAEKALQPGRHAETQGLVWERNEKKFQTKARNLAHSVLNFIRRPRF